MRLTRPSHGEGGSSSSIGMAIAAAVMVGAIVLATVMTNKPPGVDPAKALYEDMAANALDVIVHDPGRTSAGVINWAATPDVLTRFGLALPGQPNFIDYQKVESLRNGTLVANATNNAPDYPEVKAAIGIPNGVDFHLRTYPVLPSLEDPRWTKDPHGRLAYFAHFSGASSPVNLTTTVTQSSATLNVSVTLTNVGSSPALYITSISLGNSTTNATLVDGDERNTDLLPPGASQTVWVNFDQQPKWPAGVNGIHVTVTDGYGNIAIDQTNAQVGDYWIAQGALPTGSANAYDVLDSATQPYFINGTPISFGLDAQDPFGNHVGGATARFVLVGPNGNEWKNYTFTWNSSKKNTVWTDVCANCTLVGNYTGVLWDAGMSRRAQDVAYLAAAKMFTAKATIDPIAQTEVTLLTQLVSNFNPTTYDATLNPQGDVFPDDINGPSEIVPLLPRYNWLVVGSEVSQTALDASATKNGIANWVQTGGHLVVLGTYQSQSRWLEPIYHAAQNNANGGISAPDPTNPILTSPEVLSYDRYLDRGRAWQIDTSEPFTHVLTRGVSGTSDEDTLAYANPGALGNGTVVLTSYIPGSLTQPQDNGEAEKLLHNLLAQGYTMLFLDYGPSIPDGVPVGSATRLVAVPYPDLPGAVVEVRIVMYVFG
jgi:hypothetical protein